MVKRLGYQPLTRESEPALLPEIYRRGTKAAPDRAVETERRAHRCRRTPGSSSPPR